MKILIAGTRELCYFSGSFFLDRMQEALERAGVEVVRLDFFGDQADFSELEQYIGQSFDAVIDINSKLPYLVDENNRRILDLIDAPFFNYIVDHPLYHHPGLQIPLKRYYAVGIDAYHCAYMKKYYPNLSDVFCLPLAGTKALITNRFEDRKKAYLFLGTYLLDDDITHRIQRLRNEINNATYQLALDLYESWNVEKRPIEEELTKLLTNYSGAKSEDEIVEYIQDVYELSGFPELLNHMFLVDQKKRNSRRLDLLTILAESGEKIDVVGEGWESTGIGEYSNVSVKRGCSMSRSFEVMNAYQKVFDINPLFHSGFHDRVSSAMANGCLCISDMVPGLDKDLVNGENIVLYKRKNLESVLEELSAQSQEQISQIASNGYKLWKENYTWETHGLKWIELVKNISKKE